MPELLGFHRRLVTLRRRHDVHTLFIRELREPLRVHRSAPFLFGFQRLTHNNRGAEVYGGSALTVVRGDFDALLAQDVSPEIRLAIGQARRYNAAVIACYPGFFASRNNYDIVLGRDAAGRSRSGVLEQSWRLGGATGAEIAALEIFRNQPGRDRVCASAIEIFGESPPPPMHATVYFCGNDPRVGRLTKYTVVETDAHP